MNNETNEYFTKDLGEASALLCKSAKLLHLQQENNFFWFVFTDKALCNELANAYWANELQISAKSYYDAMRSLKDRLFSRR